MLRRIMIFTMAAALTGGLFAPQAQARGGGGEGHGGNHISGFHEMRIPAEVGDTRIGSEFGRNRMSSAGGYNIMGDDYSIMTPEKGSMAQKPEPWLAPTYKSPRWTVKSAIIPKSRIVTPPSANIPPSVVVPQTGQTFQNLPTLSGSGPGGTETFQDRAARCANQAGIYGQASSGSYMGACVNQ